MVTGFEIDNQAIAKSQVAATLELVKAIQNLTEMLEKKLEFTNDTLTDMRSHLSYLEMPR